MKKIRIISLIIALLIPLLVGGISAALTMQGMSVYGLMDKPPLSPPAWLFPIAWTILYLMMGLASYYIFVSDVDTRIKAIALAIYGIQLAFNFMWSIIFFNWGRYSAAFIWIIVLLCIVVVCAMKFSNISRRAGCLLIPYILWLGFAAYLNMGAYVLSVKC